MSMNDAYNANVIFGLTAILTQTGAGDYFATLPIEIQQAINEHADEIHSREELEAFADTMMKKR